MRWPLALLALPLWANTYTTTFTATENPISENSSWINGASGGSGCGGQCWGNVQTTPGLAFGVSEPTTFGDPSAVVAGVWGPNQTVTETVKVNTQPTVCCHEVEARLLTTITSGSIKGYEINYSCVSGNKYIQLVRWEGPNGSFTQLDQLTPSTACTNGDVIIATASVSGSTVTFTFKVNGTLQTFSNCSCANPHDSSGSAILSGNPGLGFYDNQDSNWNFFGFSKFTATDSASPQTVTPGSCNTTDVANALSLSSAGDTVAMPPGTCAWSSGVTISGKAVTLSGAGSGRIIAYSTSTLTLGTGSKTLTVSPDNANGTPISITNGQTLRIQELGFRSNFMTGTVTSYNSGTGSLVMNITSSGGTCGTAGPANTMNSNCKRWMIATQPSPATTITNNSSSVLFSLTESTTGNLNIGNFKIAEGSGADLAFQLFRASSGQAMLFHDMWIEGNGDNAADMIDGNTSRGVIWNVSADASPPANSTLTFFRIKDDSNTAMPNSWITTSTMGTNDAAMTAFCPTCLAGQNNFYLETNDFHAFILSVWDCDSNCRMVMRHNVLDNSGGGSHGDDTSTIGLRHFEIYNNLGLFEAYSDGSTANMNWWQFVRGGTFAIHDNVFPAISSQDWGAKPDVDLAVENLGRISTNAHPCWGEGSMTGMWYYAPRQVGFGRVTGSGSTQGTQASCGTSATNCNPSTFFFGPASVDFYTYIGDSEPAYVWNNTRTSGGSVTSMTVGYATPYTDCPTADSEANYIVLNRDYFNGPTTAKPSYTPYIYPQPLTGGGTCVILPTTLGPYIIGQAVSVTFSNSGCNSSTWSTSGSFPTGLSFNTSTGVLSGAVGGAPATFTPSVSYDTATNNFSIKTHGPSVGFSAFAIGP